MTVVLLGVVTSLLTEVITWLNKKLTGTLLQGMGAYLVSILVSVVGAFLYTVIFEKAPLSWETMVAIWGVSQVWFTVIASKLGLAVK